MISYVYHDDEVGCTLTTPNCHPTTTRLIDNVISYVYHDDEVGFMGT